MSEITCRLCEKRVSEWQMASGKTIIIANQIVHKSCALDQGTTINTLEARIENLSHGRAGLR